MHHNQFWNWVRSDGASLAESWLSNVAGTVIGGIIGASVLGIPGMFAGGIAGASIGVVGGYYLRRNLSATASRELKPSEDMAGLLQKLEESSRKNREEFYLKQKAQQDVGPIEEYVVVFEGYNANTGHYRFKRTDNGGFVHAQVRDFSGGIGTGDTLIFRRGRGSSWATVELI
jgi:hypothetical protein